MQLADSVRLKQWNYDVYHLHDELLLSLGALITPLTPLFTLPFPT